MTEELKKLKDKLGRQERLEDEVYILITYITVTLLVQTCWFPTWSFDSLIFVWDLGDRVAKQRPLAGLYKFLVR